MALYADRVKQSLGVTGTGTITLTLATTGTGYQSFLTAFGTGTQTVAYCIADQSGPNWEVGTGTYNGSANTLARTTVLASSNGGSLTNFSGGTQDVFCTAPAKYLDAFTSTNQGVVPASGGGTANFLRADGSFAAPPTTAPAGANTQIQYSNGTAFAASSTFTYTVGTTTLTVPTINATKITTNNGTSASGTNFLLQPGSGSGAGNNGGNAEFYSGGGSSGASGGLLAFYSGGGNGNGSGGDITFTAGNGNGTGVGGNFTFNAGAAQGTGTGGTLNIYAGQSISGTGGDVYLFPGDGPVASGSLILSDGNNILIQCQSIGASCIGFFGAAPVAQPTTATASATRTPVIGTVANVGDKYDNYTLAQVVKALRDLGILA